MILPELIDGKDMRGRVWCPMPGLSGQARTVKVTGRAGARNEGMVSPAFPMSLIKKTQNCRDKHEIMTKIF